MGQRGVTWAIVTAFVVGAIVTVPAAPASAVVHGWRVDDARFAEAWSFTVHLSEGATGGGRSGFCTGVLVDPSWVLTAGHCLEGRVGGPIPPGGGRVAPSASLDIQIGYGSPVVSTGEFEPVAGVVYPAGYEPMSGTDLALLELASPVNPGAIVGPAALAEHAEDVPTPDTQVEVAGWGHTAAGATWLPEQLHEGTKTLSHPTGEALVWTTGPSGLCQGDSGGPMSTSRRVVGIAVVASADCMASAGHAPVHPMLGWIDGVVGGLGPVARPDVYRVPVGTTLTVDAADGVLANDSLYLTLAPGTVVELVEPPAAGGFTFDESDGSFTYDPEPRFRGTDGFVYRLTKGDRQSLAYAELVVTAAPTAVDDEYGLVLDDDAFDVDPAAGTVQAVLAVEAPGVLANDVGPSLSAVLARPPDAPSDDVRLDLDLAPDGGFLLELTLDLDEATEERLDWLVAEVVEVDFGYRAWDGTESSDEASVRVAFCRVREDCGESTPPAPPPSPTLVVGDILEGLEAPTVLGEDWRLSDVADDVVILHLCAAWCGPCRQLAQQLGSELQDLGTTYGADTFEIVEVLLEDSTGAPSGASVASFWADAYTGDTITVLHADRSRDSAVWQLAEAIGLEAIPTLVMLDADRRIVDIRTVGAHEGTFGDAIETVLAAGDQDERDAADLLHALRGEVGGEVPGEDGTSLNVTLGAAERLLTDDVAGNDVAVPQLLGAFVAQVDAGRRRGLIDPDDAERWTGAATAIATQLTGAGD